MRGILEIITFATAVACGLAAGVFFAFSAFIMPALDRLRAAEGIAAMQSINRLAVTPPFMTALFAPALSCVALVVWAVLSLDQVEAPWVIAGSVLYLGGTIVVTIAANVPRNDALAGLDPGDAAAPARWSEYVRGWTAWNHVRTVAALAAAALLTIALTVD